MLLLLDEVFPAGSLDFGLVDQKLSLGPVLFMDLAEVWSWLQPCLVLRYCPLLPIELVHHRAKPDLRLTEQN